jgi:hypothetical protein
MPATALPRSSGCRPLVLACRPPDDMLPPEGIPLCEPVGSSDPDKGVETSSPVDGSHQHTREAREYCGRQPVTRRERRGHDATAEPVDSAATVGTRVISTASRPRAAAGRHDPAGPFRASARSARTGRGPAAAEVRHLRGRHALVGRGARWRRRDDDVAAAAGDSRGRSPLADPTGRGCGLRRGPRSSGPRAWFRGSRCWGWC